MTCRVSDGWLQWDSAEVENEVKSDGLLYGVRRLRGEETTTFNEIAKIQDANPICYVTPAKEQKKERITRHDWIVWEVPVEFLHTAQIDLGAGMRNVVRGWGSGGRW